jgi:S-adenosylmethionine hydrolase
LKQFDLTHEISRVQRVEAAFRRAAADAVLAEQHRVWCLRWDPGVGTARKAVVARTESGQLIVGPDNGTLTFLADSPVSTRCARSTSRASA